MTEIDPTEPEIEPMVNAATIARLLGMAQRTVQRHAEAGELPAYRIGRQTWRFRVSEVLAAVEHRGRRDG